MVVEQEQVAARKQDRMRAVLDRDRQAVVVIHGIGDQRPMDTLRPFVDAVLGVDPKSESSARYYSKPDEFSSTFELRRLQSKDSRPRTDYFELYWQHLVPTATWRKIVAWLQLLLSRRPRDVPPPLRGLWFASWVISIGVGCFLALSLVAWMFPAVPWIPDWINASVTKPLGMAAILAVLQGLILSYVGDAATYLSPNPENIEARQAVREAGVELLEQLHGGNGKELVYDRIVIVGHSLGSVIGYDILTYAWSRFNDRHGSPPSPVNDEVHAAELLARSLWTSPSPALRNEWLKSTRRLWLEQRQNRFAWRVTDFITLGSPLAHSLLLLARNGTEFARKKEQRELPTSPPRLDGSTFAYTVKYPIENDALRSVYCLHHAALFAVTRWTNLFFPVRMLLKGDLVGGAIAPALGPGVLDIPVTTGTSGGWLAHTSYWRPGKGDRAVAASAINELVKALDIGRHTFRDSEIKAAKPGETG